MESCGSTLRRVWMIGWRGSFQSNECEAPVGEKQARPDAAKVAVRQIRGRARALGHRVHPRSPAPPMGKGAYLTRYRAS